MIAYKLLKVRKDGSVGSLFINRSAILPLNTWLQAEDLHKKGYAHRPGWHATQKPQAPHLKVALSTGENRVWYEVELEDVQEEQRPENQGGTWLIAQRIRIIGPAQVQS